MVDHLCFFHDQTFCRTNIWSNKNSQSHGWHVNHCAVTWRTLTNKSTGKENRSYNNTFDRKKIEVKATWIRRYRTVETSKVRLLLQGHVRDLAYQISTKSTSEIAAKIGGGFAGTQHNDFRYSTNVAAISLKAGRTEEQRDAAFRVTRILSLPKVWSVLCLMTYLLSTKPHRTGSWNHETGSCQNKHSWDLNVARPLSETAAKLCKVQSALKNTVLFHSPCWERQYLFNFSWTKWNPHNWVRTEVNWPD